MLSPDMNVADSDAASSSVTSSYERRSELHHALAFGNQQQHHQLTEGSASGSQPSSRLGMTMKVLSSNKQLPHFPDTEPEFILSATATTQRGSNDDDDVVVSNNEGGNDEEPSAAHHHRDHTTAPLDHHYQQPISVIFPDSTGDEISVKNSSSLHITHHEQNLTITTRQGTWAVGDEDTHVKPFPGGGRLYGTLVCAGPDNDIYHVGGVGELEEEEDEENNLAPFQEDNNTTAILHRLDRATGDWKAVELHDDANAADFILVGGLLPSRLSQHTAVAHGNHIYIVGAAAFSRIFVAIDVVKHTVWLPPVRTINEMPSRWHCHTAVLVEPRVDEPTILFYGGADLNGTVGSVYSYEIKTGFFRQLVQDPCQLKPPARLYHSAVAARKRYMYVFGGAPDAKTTEPGDEVFNDLWRFDSVTEEWEYVRPLSSLTSSTGADFLPTTTAANNTIEASTVKPAHRGSMTLHFCEPYLYIFGGFDGTADHCDFHYFDVDNKTWHTGTLPSVVCQKAGVWGYASCFDPVVGRYLFVGGFGSSKPPPASTNARGGNSEPELHLVLGQPSTAQEQQQQQEYHHHVTHIVTGDQHAGLTLIHDSDDDENDGDQLLLDHNYGMDDDAQDDISSNYEDENNMFFGTLTEQQQQAMMMMHEEEEDDNFPWKVTDTVVSFSPSHLRRVTTTTQQSQRVSSSLLATALSLKCFAERFLEAHWDDFRDDFERLGKPVQASTA